MARSKQQQVTFIRLLFKLLIFVAIIQQNYGHAMNPIATAAAAAVADAVDSFAYEIELSSPVPFTTRKTEISAKTIIENLNPSAQDIAKAEENSSISSLAGTSSTTFKTLETNLKDLINEESLTNNNNAHNNDNNNNNNNNDNDNDNNSYDDYLETDLKLEKTTPTSMEQQDDPVIPPTTITFSNVAAAGILGDSNSNIDSVVTGGSGNGNANDGSDNFASGPLNNFNDATPPYAAVDEKYGKLAVITFNSILNEKKNTFL